MGLCICCFSGKSTLTDSLVAAAGIIAQEVAGDVRLMDTREMRQREASPSSPQGFHCIMRCRMQH